MALAAMPPRHKRSGSPVSTRLSRALWSTERVFVAAVAKHMVGAGHSGPGLGALCARKSAFVCLEEPKPGRRQAVKAEAREAGARQSAQPLRPEAGPVHCYQQQKDMPAGRFGRQATHRPHRTSSKLAFSDAQETGSAIQRLMSDSCQPVPFGADF